jgi:hypothetical protein
MANANERYEPDLTDLYDEVWFYPYHPRKGGFEVAAPASSLPLPIPAIPEELDLDSFEDDEF